MCHLMRLLRQGLIVVFTRTIRIQSEIELIFPAKFKACLGHGIVANLRSRMPLGQVGRVSSQLVSNNAFFHIVTVR